MEKAIAALLCFEWGLGFLESGPLFFKHTTRNDGPTQTQIIFAKIRDGKFELDVKPVEYVAKHSVVVIPEKNGNNVVLVDSSKLYAALDGFFVDASALGEMIMWKTEMRFSDASDLFSRDRGVLQEGKLNQSRKEWAVSKHDTPSGIMMYDGKTIDSLRERLFGNNYKGDKSFVITKVLEKR